MNKAKLDHFIEFSNHPYFYQDVSYGTQVLKLESGERLAMPNVIRTVTKSTLISEYQKHCTKTEFSLLSHATLFRILNVREACQRKSLHGLDNTAADGSSAFDSMENILNSLQEASNEKISWYEQTRKSLRASKKYLKTDFRCIARRLKAHALTIAGSMRLVIPKIRNFRNCAATSTPLCVISAKDSLKF